MLLLAGLIYSASFLSQCSPTVSPTTTRAIIQVESGGNPLAIGDNDLRQSFAPKTRSEAVSLATQLISQGHGVDLGLMQINSCHLASLRLSLDELFDPCQNVRAGSTSCAPRPRPVADRSRQPGGCLFNNIHDRRLELSCLQ